MKEKEYYDFLVEQMCEDSDFRENFDKMKKLIPVSAMPWSKNYYDCKVEDCLTGASFSVCSEYEPEVKIISLEKDEHMYYMHMYRCDAERIKDEPVLGASRSCGNLCARFEYQQKGDKWPRLIILFDLIKCKNNVYLACTKHKKIFEDDKNDVDFRTEKTCYHKIPQDKVEEFLTEDTLNV